jgi:hypothetical protein
MKTALLVATGLMTISTTASAGVFLGLGVGGTPGVNDEMSKDVGAPSGRSLRALGGYNFGTIADTGTLSVEGSLGGFGVVASNRGDETMYQISAAARFNLPLGNGFEAFGRLGLERTWLNVGDDRYNWAGNGFLLGAGFAYRLDGLITNAAVFVDYNVHQVTLADTRDQRDMTAGIWALGFTIGL